MVDLSRITQHFTGGYHNDDAKKLYLTGGHDPKLSHCKIETYEIVIGVDV